MLNNLVSYIKKVNGNKPWGMYSFAIMAYTSIIKMINTVKGIFIFLKNKKSFLKLAKNNNITITGYYPILTDIFENAGTLDSHYFLQDLYMAKKVLENKIPIHYDIGSRVDGFLGHLLASNDIRQVTMLDVRPLSLNIDNLKFIQTDATNLAEIPDNSIESISSLHALEHFGLGRYGDPLDPLACYKAMKSIQRVTKENGYIFISVPVSSQDELWFNGLRKFSPITVIEQFDQCELVEFSILHDFKIRTYDGTSVIIDLQKNQIPVSHLDCGMFIFRKQRFN